jgi:hypothetical protein
MAREDEDDTIRASEPPPPAERPSQPPPAGESRRRRFEHILPELIKRGIEKGIEAGLGTLSRTDEAVRGAVAEGKLPREIVSYVFTAIDDTKNGMMRVVGREVRDFLQATDLSKELQKALTSLSFEIKTEIRFIPNDAGTGVKADIKAGSTSVKRRSTPPPEGDADPLDAADDGEPPPTGDEEASSARGKRPRARRSP